MDSTLYKGDKGYVIYDFPDFLHDRDLFDKRCIDILNDLKESLTIGEIERDPFAIEVLRAYYECGICGKSVNVIDEEAKAFWLEWVEREENSEETAWYPYTQDVLSRTLMFSKNILVSGSPREVLEYIPFDKEAFFKKYASEGVVENGVYTGGFVNLATEDAKKKLITKMSINKKLSFAFGDSESDIPLFNAVNPQNSFLFCEDKKELEYKKPEFFRIGIEAGWKILQYNDNVIGILENRIREVFK